MGYNYTYLEFLLLPAPFVRENLFRKVATENYQCELNGPFVRNQSPIGEES